MASKVYFTNFRTGSKNEPLPHKLKRLGSREYELIEIK